VSSLAVVPCDWRSQANTKKAWVLTFARMSGVLLRHLFPQGEKGHHPRSLVRSNPTSGYRSAR
jgi:hypothetical protein